MLIHTYGKNGKRVKLKRVIRNIKPARFDWLGRFGLLVGEATVDGEMVLVCRYKSQRHWWIWDIGHGNPR